MSTDNHSSELPPFSLEAQYVKDISFENPTPLDSFSLLEKKQPNINVDIQVQAQSLSQESSEVTLDLRVESKVDDKTIYICELSYSGILVVSPDVPQDISGQLVMVYAPTMLFPFARSIISNVIRDGGFPPLMLNPVDFLSIYQNQLENEKNDQSVQ